MKRVLILLVTGLLLTVFTGCADTKSHSRGIYMLLDTSGTYTKELDKAASIINYLLGTLDPGDSFAVARIDSGSFSEKDIIAKVTFDTRPSTANSQKRAFKETVDSFVKSVKGSPYTDISGGLLQATEYLDEAGAGKKYVLIFSDLEEELVKGHVRDFDFTMDGYQVIALNVTKLRADIKDPKEYLDRLDVWQGKIEQGGGQWRVVNDLDRLDSILN